MVFYFHCFRITNEHMVLAANETCVLSLEVNYDIVFLLWRNEISYLVYFFMRIWCIYSERFIVIRKSILLHEITYKISHDTLTW